MPGYALWLLVDNGFFEIILTLFNLESLQRRCIVMLPKRLLTVSLDRCSLRSLSLIMKDNHPEVSECPNTDAVIKKTADIRILKKYLCLISFDHQFLGLIHSSINKTFKTQTYVNLK